jgi:hypothetical protein
VNRKQLLKANKKGKNGEGVGGERPGTKGKFQKPDGRYSDNQRNIDGKLMHYHFRDGRWKPVDKTPAPIASVKKSAAKAAKLAAAAALLTAEGGDPAVPGMIATSLAHHRIDHHI